MDFRMKDFGAVLESRDLAKSLCQSILDEHWKRPDEHKRIDFGGVRVVSSFFADEFIGGLVVGLGTEGFKESLTLLNVSEMNRIWIERALERRKDAPVRVAPPAPQPPAVKAEPVVAPKPEPRPAPKPEKKTVPAEKAKPAAKKTPEKKGPAKMAAPQGKKK